MADSGSFAADTEELKRAGVDIVHLSGLAENIYRDLYTTLSAHPNPGGQGDDIAKSVKANYTEGAAAGLKFMDQVVGLLQNHGQLTDDLGDVVEGADADATTISGHHGKK